MDDKIIYENIGNIPKDIFVEHYVVTPHKKLVTNNLVLKVYELLPLMTRGNPFRILEAKQFVEEQIINGTISTHSGMGFMIVAKDTVNVVRWGGLEFNVPVGQLYAYKEALPDYNYTRLDVNQEGALCMHEHEILQHEVPCWRRFLNSKKTDFDKKLYLDEMLCRCDLNPLS
ncbi:MAG: hypothetical protein V1837_05410 [Candidatus Woesearchaeota archaeon]